MNVMHKVEVRKGAITDELEVQVRKDAIGSGRRRSGDAAEEGERISTCLDAWFSSYCAGRSDGTAFIYTSTNSKDPDTLCRPAPTLLLRRQPALCHRKGSPASSMMSHADDTE